MLKRQKYLFLALGVFFVFGSFIFGSFIFGSGLAMAQADRVVAVVDGLKIRMSDLETIRKAHPQAQHMPLDEIYDQLVDMAIETALLDTQAKAANLQDDPDVLKRLEEVKANLMRRAYLKMRRDEALTDKVLQKRYVNLLVKNPPQEQLKVSQILTETEAQAKAVIAELLAGADFADLAKRVSIGQSAKKGGALGFIARPDVPATFSEAAFALAVGSFTKSPVKTSLGWHVILVVAKRMIDPPAFEDIKEDLVRDLTEKISKDVILELRHKADVVRYEPNGEIVR